MTSQKSRLRAIYFWNMAGSFCNAISSFILTVIVNRINGSADGGVYSLAYAISYQMSTIALFEIRHYQATDLTDKYSFSNYFSLRIITCIATMIISVGYIFSKGCTGQTVLIALLWCAFRVMLALSDVFQGLFQKNERLDLAGKTLAFQVVLSSVTFAISLYLTHSLLISSIFPVLITVIWIFIYDVPRVNNFDKIKFSFDFKAFGRLLIECLPAFAGAFMLQYLTNAPKYAVNAISSETLNIYNNMAMIAFVINLFSLFAFRPKLTFLTTCWLNSNNKKFLKTTAGLVLWIGVVTIIAIGGAALLGIPVLSMVYGISFEGYRTVLLVIVAAGGFSALATFFSALLTVMRKQSRLWFIYAVPCVLTFFISPMFVKLWGIMGAAVAYLTSMFVLAVIFILFILYFVKKLKIS